LCLGATPMGSLPVLDHTQVVHRYPSEQQRSLVQGRAVQHLLPRCFHFERGSRHHFHQEQDQSLKPSCSSYFISGELSSEGNSMQNSATSYWPATSANFLGSSTKGSAPLVVVSDVQLIRSARIGHSYLVIDERHLCRMSRD
jgi:hypothetical protein